MVPHWKSMNAADFYSYYGKFGPAIGRYFTVLTITAALLPLFVMMYSWNRNRVSFRFAALSFFFALLFIAAFYVYFKGANEAFLNAAYSSQPLAEELARWSYWHWGRVGIECLSLACLVLAIRRL